MKQRYQLPPTLGGKYNNDICFMVETDVTCMEVVEPRFKFIDPMGYEMSEELIKGYAKIILQSEKDVDCPRWGTYKEKMKEAEDKLYRKDI